MRDIVSDDPVCGGGICWKNVMDMWNFISKSYGREKENARSHKFLQAMQLIHEFGKKVSSNCVVELCWLSAHCRPL